MLSQEDTADCVSLPPIIAKHDYFAASTNTHYQKRQQHSSFTPHQHHVYGYIGMMVYVCVSTFVIPSKLLSVSKNSSSGLKLADAHASYFGPAGMDVMILINNKNDEQEAENEQFKAS